METKSFQQEPSLFLFGIRGSKVSIVDLAGSERLKNSKKVDQRTLQETKAINKSLFTLGQVRNLAFRRKSGFEVLWAIRSRSRGKCVEAPYRESKLTQLLWDGLHGSGRTLMIACCTPFRIHWEETMHTLTYASTAIRIKSVPKVLLDPQQQLIKNLKDEIARLKSINQQLSRKLDELKNGRESVPAPSKNASGSFLLRNNDAVDFSFSRREQQFRKRSCTPIQCGKRHFG